MLACNKDSQHSGLLQIVKFKRTVLLSHAEFCSEVKITHAYVQKHQTQHYLMCCKKFTLCQSCLQGIITPPLTRYVSFIAQISTCAGVGGGWRGKVTFSKQSSMHVPNTAQSSKPLRE